MEGKKHCTKHKVSKEGRMGGMVNYVPDLGFVTLGLRESGCNYANFHPGSCTGRMGWMAHRKWKEAKKLPGTAGPGNMLGCCLFFFHFLWAIHPIRPVNLESQIPSLLLTDRTN